MTTSENNNGNYTLLMALILSLIFLIFATSCSTRKVNKSEIKETEQTEIKATEQIKTDLVENTKIIDTSTTDEIEFIPIDNTLPFTVKGQTYKNVKIKHSKKKNNISIVKDKKVSQIKDKSANLTYNKDRVIEMKTTERKSFNFWWLLLLLIPSYFLYQKIKNLI
jgi:hypothetical protein